MEKKNYSTEQRRLILNYLEQHADAALTAGLVYESLCACGSRLGRTTVYRALERLAEDGILIKTPASEGRTALYRYVGREPSSAHLVCLECGKTMPLECDELSKLVRHIGEEHSFEVDTRHSVLYGECEECRRKKCGK